MLEDLKLGFSKSKFWPVGAWGAPTEGSRNGTKGARRVVHDGVFKRKRVSEDVTKVFNMGVRNSSGGGDKGWKSGI